jgi:hypothetical protein
MAAMLKMPPKPHSDMKLGSKKKAAKRKRKAAPKAK